MGGEKLTVSWEHPVPRYFVYDIWMASETDGYLVGKGGMVMHFDGADWNVVDLGTTQHFRLVWGSSEDDVYIGGDALLHFDGVSWSEVGPEGPRYVADIWGSSASDVYAAAPGTSEGVYHYDGTAWTLLDIPMEYNPLCVHGSGPEDVYVGSRGMYHYDGMDWQQVDGFEDRNIASIWANAPGDVWALSYSTLSHYDGTTWEDSVALFPWADKLFGNASGEMYAAGGSIVYSLTGGEWQPMYDFSTDVPYVRIGSIYGSAPGSVWVGGGMLTSAVGGGFLEHVTDGASDTAAQTVMLREIADVWTDPYGDRAYAVGFQAVLERSGGRWRRVHTQFGADGKRVWYSAPSLYVLFGTAIYAGRSENWVRVSGEYEMADMAAGDRVLWAVGEGGVYRVGNVSMESVLGTSWLTVVGTNLRGDVLALGNDRMNRNELVIAWYTGGEWTIQRSKEQFQPSSIVGYDRWGFLVGGWQAAEGNGARIWLVTPQRWDDITPPEMTMVVALGGNRETGYLAADYSGRLFHYDGHEWTEIESPFYRYQVLGISKSPGSVLFACGYDGAIVRIGAAE